MRKDMMSSHLYNENMQPRLSGDCGAEAESAATDAAGAGGGSTADGAAKDATAAAEKARTFSQEDVDRMTAEARRQGKESAKKAADAQIEKIATKTRDSLLEEFRKQGILKDGAAATGDKGAGSATHGAEAGADKSKGTAQNAAQGATAGDADKGKGAVDPAILALQEEVKAERAARVRLEKDREREISERKAAQDKARREQVITEVAEQLKAVGVADGMSRGLAKTLIADEKILFDDKRILFVTDERDEDDERIKLPLKDGVVAWGKTSAADEYRPPVRSGAGTGDRRLNPTGQPQPVDPRNQTELERWKAAESQTKHIFNKERAGNRA
jgi:hypothetical protein